MLSQALKFAFIVVILLSMALPSLGSDDLSINDLNNLLTKDEIAKLKAIKKKK